MQKWMCGGALVLCVLAANVASGTPGEAPEAEVMEGVEVGHTETDAQHLELPEEGILLIQQGEDVYARPMTLPLPKNPLLAPPQPFAQRR